MITKLITSETEWHQTKKQIESKILSAPYTPFSGEPLEYPAIAVGSISYGGIGYKIDFVFIYGKDAKNLLNSKKEVAV